MGGFFMIKVPTKEEIKFLMRQKKFLVIISILAVLLSVLGVVVFTGAINTPLTDPLAGFQAPIYIPDGYVNVANNSTAGVDKSFTYADKKNGDYFVVAAVKDMNKSEYSELMNEQLSEQIEGVKTTSENMTVNGHPVTFRMMSMDLMGMQMNMFQATWTCTQNNLNIVTTGNIKANEKEAIQKMITSIKCHTEKQEWKIPGL